VWCAQSEKTLKLFGEEPHAVSADEFFGVFELFLVSFADARLDNERLRRLREDDEKRQRREAQVSGSTHTHGSSCRRWTRATRAMPHAHPAVHRGGCSV